MLNLNTAKVGIVWCSKEQELETFFYSPKNRGRLQFEVLLHLQNNKIVCVCVLGGSVLQQIKAQSSS